MVRSFSLSVRGSGGDDSIERVHVNEVLAGAWFTSPEDLQADRVFVDLRHLTGWVDRSGISESYPSTDDSSDPRFVVVTATALPPLRTGGGAVDVQLVHRLGTLGDHIYSLGVTQGWSLQLTHPALRPISTFLDMASDIQDLLSIAVGTTADFERVVVHHPKLLALSLAGTPWGGGQRADVTFHARWSNNSDPSEPADRHDMYFTLADLGGIDAVGRWLDQAERYRTELGRVMATRYSAKMYVEDRIMNICAALDSFDKVRRGTSADYVERITQCVALAGQPFLNLIPEGSVAWAQPSRRLGTTSPIIENASDSMAPSGSTSSPNNSSGSLPCACFASRKQQNLLLTPSPNTPRFSGSLNRPGAPRREETPAADSVM